jgi:hypothetical protein
MSQHIVAWLVVIAVVIGVVAVALVAILDARRKKK